LDGRENKSEKTRTAVLSRNDKSQQQQQQNKKDEENIYNQPKKKGEYKRFGCALFPDADGHIQTRYKQQQHETIIDLFRSTFCLLPKHMTKVCFFANTEIRR
jgi:hypothetical protein